MAAVHAVAGSWRQYVYRAAARDRWHTARSKHAGDTLVLDTLLL